MKTLVIVESPKKAKSIQTYLDKDYIVLSSKGHITELAKGKHHNIGVDIDDNFKPTYVIASDKVDTVKALMNAAKSVDQILISSDPDREGEAIAWHLEQRLKDFGKPIKRMVFHEINKKEVKKALSQLRDIDMNLFKSQEARRILDRIVGFTASPFLMNNFGNNLSAGRVQSVVTRMVADREEEIQNFEPEDFWNIKVSLIKDSPFVVKHSKRITSQAQSDTIVDILKNPANKYIVSDVVAKVEKKGAPPPFITSTLQQHMSKKHGMSADRTMKAAQSLYEQGLCTYIRTDSVRVSDDAIADARDELEKRGFAIPKKANVFSNKEAAQDAHEAIRPSSLAVDPTETMQIADSDEKLVYEAIYNQFLASQMNPAIYNTLNVSVLCDKELLKASGKALQDPGFLKMLNVRDDSKIDIPMLEKGDECSLFGKNPIISEKKKTQPPSRYSESDLVSELDKRNIGRPATYAELLTKLCAKNYVEKKGNVFHTTELGTKITKVLKSYFEFMDYDYTARIEKQLDEIASGKITSLDVLNDFYGKYKVQLDEAYVKNGAQMCDKCGKPMVVRSSQTGKFYGCSGFPKCRNIKQLMKE